MLFIFVILLVMSFVLGLSIAAYINYDNINKLKNVATTKNTDIDERLGNIVSGVNYNDVTLSSMQTKLLKDIDELETSIGLMKQDIDNNEILIKSLRESLAAAGKNEEKPATKGLINQTADVVTDSLL